jgi:hypothetical protein
MTTNETGSRGRRRPLRSALGVGVVAAGTVAPRVLAGLGAPTDRVGGNAGDVFQRRDGDPGPKLFVKEPGDATTHGWAAK